MSNKIKASGSRKTAEPETDDFDAILDEEDRPEDVVSLCLRGNLVAQWRQLKEQFDTMPGDEDKAMAHERATKRRLAEQMEDLRQRMLAGTVQFRLRALPRKRTPDMAADQPVWHELVEAHPPRLDAKGKVIKEDAGFGLNRATFPEALVRGSIIKPAIDDARWAKLDAKMSDAQFEQLFVKAWALNRREIDVPFSLAASMTMTSAAGSRRRNSSASPSAGSRAGNPARSPAMNTTPTDG